MCPTCIPTCSREQTHFEGLRGEQTHFEGLQLHFNLLGCVVRASNGKVLGLASLKFNLYQLDINMMNGSQINYLVHSNASSYPLEILRKWLGHLNNNIVKMIQSMVGGT